MFKKPDRVLTVDLPDDTILVEHLSRDINVELDFSKRGELYICVIRGNDSVILLDKIVLLKGE